MSIERLRELLALGLDGRSPEQEREFNELIGRRRQEQKASIPKPICCEAIQKYPIINFVVNEGAEGDTATGKGRWRILVNENFWYDFYTGDLAEYINEMPDPEYCPFCSSSLPSMTRKNPPPPNICRVTDGGYYCDTCHERLDGCLCDPPGAAFEPCFEEPLKTIPTSKPVFEDDTDEP